VVRRKKWISPDKRPIVTVTGSRRKTIVFGSLLSLEGKQYSNNMMNLTVIHL